MSSGEIDFHDLEERYAVKDTLDVSKFVCVDGLPAVPDSKIDKLLKILLKVFSKVAAVPGGEKAVIMPQDENKKTMGFAFVRFGSEDDANAVIKAFNHKKLDPKHTMLLDSFPAIEKYLNTEKSEYKEPEVPPFKPLPHIRSWLTDEHGRDQAALHINQEVTVQWFRKGAQPQEAMPPTKNFTSMFVRWSPFGSYLLSINPKGVVLHAGPKFEAVATFPHKDVKLIDFSTDERFLVTCSPVPITPGGPFSIANEGHHIVVWSIETRSVLRSFPVPQTCAPNAPPPWPAFKWSSDSEYLAWVPAKDELAIYASSTMGLVGKKSVHIDGLQNFEFSPAKTDGKQLIAFWTPELTNQAARVALLDAETKEIVHNRALFNVVHVSFFWQNNGEFLCSLIDRLKKNKKAVFSSLEIYRFQNKSIPIEVFDFPEKVFDFSWEPFSSRFIVLKSVNPVPAPTGPRIDPPSQSARYSLGFYVLENQKKVGATWKETNEFRNQPLTRISWSPRGRFLATISMASSGTMQIVFMDADYEVQVPPATNSALPAAQDLPINVYPLANREHAGAVDYSWDPSGRYLLTYSSARDGSLGTKSYTLWDHVGRQLRQEKIGGLMAFLWRPRPKSELTRDQRRAAAKKAKELGEEFDMQDAVMAASETDDLRKFIEATTTSWSLFRKDVRNRLAERGLVPEEDMFQVKDGEVFVRRDVVVEETIEEVQ